MKRLGVLLAGAVVGALAFPGLAGAATPHFSVDIFTTSFADVTGVFAAPIEPD
jgi:hypothetical protein